MGEVLTKQLQIAERANRYKSQALTNLHHFIDIEWLEESMSELKEGASAGIDGEVLKEFRDSKSERLPELMTSFKSGRYKAPAVRRVYIRKMDGKQRPIGIPTIEDKVLQNAVCKVLEPIYEQDFYDFSYGFRPKKSAHQALERIWSEIMNKRISYILDADIENYFGSINHACLRTMLDKRVKDGVVRRQIDKWLKAGVFEEGEIRRVQEGTPQGGIISPLLSNIYLHEVLDKWYREVEPLLKGKIFLVRYADDFIMGFEYEEDALRVKRVIFKRFEKYGLTMHPEKTRLIEFNRWKGKNTFDFLGFTHYWGKSRKGKTILKRKTGKKRLSRAIKTISNWIMINRHNKVGGLVWQINAKLRGHYAYYGITFNFRSINLFYEAVKRIMFKWLNRRGGKKKMNWEVYARLISQRLPLFKPRIVHSFL